MGYTLIRPLLTSEQREDLILLVNRRIQDLAMIRRRRVLEPKELAEATRLTEVKHELEQAGT